MNEGNNIINLESGEFRAPLAGIYAFTLHCITHEESVEISVLKNNQKEHLFLQNTSNMSGSWIFHLGEEDMVHVETTVGKCLEINFNGHLVNLDD